METASSSGKKPLFSLKTVIVFVLIWFLFQLLAGFLVARQIRKRLDLQITGTFWPVPLLPSFFSRDAKLIWKNRITLLSGNVKIDYNILPLFVNNNIRIQIHGKNISAKLSGEWARLQGVQDIVVDDFEADIAVAKKGLGEIYFVSAESPSFQFHIQRTET